MNETAQFHISFFFLKGKACAGFLILRQLHAKIPELHLNHRYLEPMPNLVALSQLLHLGPKAQQFAYYLQWFLVGQPGAVYGFGEPA